MIEIPKLLDTQRAALAGCVAVGLVKDGGRWKRADGKDNGTYATASLRKLYTLGLVKLDEAAGRAEPTLRGRDVAAMLAEDAELTVERTAVAAGRPECPQYGLAEPMPYPVEVRACEAYNSVLEAFDELQAKYEELSRKLVRSGAYSINDIGGGDLVREADEALAMVAGDIHRRGRAGEGRKVVITVKGDPAEHSAGVSWEFVVVPHLAKYEGGGTAYLDKNGKLCRPEDVGAEQIMLPLDQEGEPLAVLDPKKQQQKKAA